MEADSSCASSIAGPQFVTAPVPARLNFQKDVRGLNDDAEMTLRLAESDSRLETMLAAQAAFREDVGMGEDVDDIVEDPKLSDSQKTDILQKALNMAASNGDGERVNKILDGKAKRFVDVNGPDEEGTSPLIYASCFVRSQAGLDLSRDWRRLIWGAMPGRDIMKWLLHCLTIVQILMYKIKISGAR